MNDYGRELKRRRDAAGLTVRALGDLIERSGTFVTNFELGRASNPPEPEMMRRLEDALGWPVSDQLRAWGYPIERGPVIRANPFPPDDIRHKIVEAMTRVDLHGPEHAFWMGHFALNLRLYRDVERYGLGDDEEVLGLGGSDHLTTVDGTSRGIA